MGRFIEKVQHNIKGEEATVQLGQRTLILGPNGVGKSSIVNALELALTGSIARESGLLITKELDLMAFAGPGDSLWAEVTFNDGTVGAWKTKGSRETAKRASWSRPHFVDEKRVFPLRGLKAALTGSPEGLRTFLMGVLSVREPKLHTAMEVRDSAAEKSRRFAAEATAARKNVEAQSAGLGPEPTAASIAALKSKLDATMKQLDQVLLEVVAPPKPAPRSAPAVASDAVERARIFLPIVKAAISRGGDCPMCSTSNREGLEATAKRLAKRLADAAAVARTPAEEEEADNAAAVDSGAATLAEIQALRAEEARLRTALIQAQNLALRWSTIRKSREVLEQLDANHETAKKTASDTKEAARALLAAATTEFEEEVTRALGSAGGERFRIVFAYGDREVVQVGLDMAGWGEDAPLTQFRSELSGAEWARVSAAMAVVLGDANFSVVVPEDRAWDPKTLARFLVRAGRKCGENQQIIVTTTTAPVSLPANWTLIRLGEATPE